MDSFQEKAGGEWHRRPPSHGKKYKGEGKEGEEVREEGSGKKRNRQFRRNNDDKARDNQKNGGSQEADKPVTFNAHALDLDPGIVIPERPSIDLTYTDFTRESYEMGTGRPFVPKKKKIVPFELSETPKMQADYWEGRAPGRRKLLNAMENGAEIKANGEGQQTQEKKQPEYKKDNPEKNGDKKDKQQQKQQKDRPWSGSQNQEAKDRDRKRQEPKQQKSGQQDCRQESRQDGRQENKRPENKQNGGGRGPEAQPKKGGPAKEAPKSASKGAPLEAPRNPSKGVAKEALSEPGKRAPMDAPKEAPAEHAKRASEEAKAAPKEKKGGFFSRNKNRQNNNAAGKQEPRNKGEDQPQEPASQSLIRPYWLKK